eukprot:COSAG06_NODE_3362_length_5453_cov_5.741688_10_plen_191_part_00
MPFDTQSHHFTKTGSGQTQGGTTQKERCVALQAELTAQLTTLRQKASLDLAHASAGEKPASVLIAAGGSGRGVGFVTALISIDAKNEHLTKTGSGQTGQAHRETHLTLDNELREYSVCSQVRRQQLALTTWRSPPPPPLLLLLPVVVAAARLSARSTTGGARRRLSARSLRSTLGSCTTTTSGAEHAICI